MCGSAAMASIAPIPRQNCEEAVGAARNHNRKPRTSTVRLLGFLWVYPGASIGEPSPGSWNLVTVVGTGGHQIDM
jgi:hypothetical protein